GASIGREVLGKAPRAAANPALVPGAPTHTDLHGDPLPAGALARMGTVRWRHGDSVFFVAYLPDGKQLISASQDGTIRVWELASGKELRRLGAGVGGTGNVGMAAINGVMAWNGAGNGAFQVALSRDGKLLAATANNQVHLWDVLAGKELRKITVPQNNATAIAFSPDGKLLATRGFDQTTRLWDTATGKEVRQIVKVKK